MFITIAFRQRQSYIFFHAVSLEPSGAPLNVKAFTKSSTSILVQWNPPNELDRNGVITHYIVQYSSLGTQASINTTDNTTEILVTRLKKYTTYYFTVRAVNKIGVGPRSKDDAQNTTSEDCKLAAEFTYYSRVITYFTISFGIQQYQRLFQSSSQSLYFL